MPSVETHSNSSVTRNRGACRLLLAADDEAGALYAEVVLRSCGCSVRRTANGLQALQALKAEKFDIAFFDVHMPHMDGLTAMRRIRALEDEQRLQRLPIIIVTASVFPEQVRDCIDAGADGVLAKPFKIEELRHTLSQWTGAAHVIDRHNLA